MTILFPKFECPACNVRISEHGLKFYFNRQCCPKCGVELRFNISPFPFQVIGFTLFMSVCFAVLIYMPLPSSILLRLPLSVFLGVLFWLPFKFLLAYFYKLKNIHLVPNGS